VEKKSGSVDLEFAMLGCQLLCVEGQQRMVVLCDHGRLTESPAQTYEISATH